MSKNMLLNNKKFRVIAIIVLVYLLFASIVIITFYSTKNNSFDKVAMPYIWTNNDIEREYGEITDVFRYVGEDIKKKDNTIKVPYSVYTKDYRVIIYVTLEGEKKDLKAVSLEILEVRDNDN